MTTYTYYVDTEAVDGNGDGSTELHEESVPAAGDHACATLNQAEAQAQADHSGAIGAGDIVEFLCAGATVDTTAVTVGGWTINATGALHIKGNRSAAGSDGFYDSTEQWSTSHYRLEMSGDYIVLALNEPRVTVDGIQLRNSGTGSFRTGIGTSNNASELLIQNNRLRMNKSATNAKIFNKSSSNINTDIRLKQNLFLESDYGVRWDPRSSDTTSRTLYVYNNIFRDMTTVGMDVLKNGSGDVTLDMKNNAFFDCGDEIDIDVSGTQDYNAGEESDVYSETNGVNIGISPWEDDFADPTNGTEASRDYEAQSGGDIDGAGIGNTTDSEVPTTDFLGRSRATGDAPSGPTIGPFEVQGGGGPSFVPYPNPRNAMTGGMQDMRGGV